MKNLILIAISLFAFLSASIAQVDKFKFEIDGEPYLKIQKNNGGFNIINQHASQSSMFFGYNSGLNTIVDPEVFNSGENNSAYGSLTLESNTSGFQNTAMGSRAMKDNMTGTANTAIGFSSLGKNVSGTSNVSIGQSSLLNNIDGGYNVAIGNSVLSKSTTAENSVAIGHTAGTNDTISTDNVYVGFGAGRGTVYATDGYNRYNNVLIGAYSGYYCKTNGNVFLGHKAGINAKVDNQLYITNSATDSLSSLIYGQFDNELLRINGDLNIDGLYTMPNTTPAVGQYLVNNGGTNLSWGNIPTIWDTGAGDDVIYEDGDVGIGIGNPEFRLHVADNAGNGYAAKFHNTSTVSNSRGIIIQAGPNTNPTSSSYYVLLLDGNGTNIGGIRGNGSGGSIYSTTSDKRLKQNIRTFDGGLETLDKITPTIYQMKSNPSVDEIGFIAQDLQKVLPLVVGGNPNDDVEESPMTVDYGRITPVLAAAIKEQQMLIETLTKRLDEQDNQLKELLSEIRELKGSK